MDTIDTMPSLVSSLVILNFCLLRSESSIAFLIEEAKPALNPSI